MISRILASVLLISMLGNGVTAALYYRAKAKTATLVSEIAAEANAQLAESLSRQAAAYATQIAELERIQSQSDQAAKDAVTRALEATAALDEYKKAQEANREDPVYVEWADVELPSSVKARLEALQ